MGKHSESLIKLLVDHGATLASGDVPQYACYAVEQDDLKLLQDIVRYGGDVTLPNSNGTTPLHAAVTRENTSIVKFLLEQGAEVDKFDANGLSPRSLADFHGNEEVKVLFDSTKPASLQSNEVLPDKKDGSSFLKKYSSTGTIDVTLVPSPHEISNDQKPPRGRANVFENSLFGVMSAATRGEYDSMTLMACLVAGIK